MGVYNILSLETVAGIPDLANGNIYKLLYDVQIHRPVALLPADSYIQTTNQSWVDEIALREGPVAPQDIPTGALVQRLVETPTSQVDDGVRPITDVGGNGGGNGGGTGDGHTHDADTIAATYGLNVAPIQEGDFNVVLGNVYPVDTRQGPVIATAPDASSDDRILSFVLFDAFRNAQLEPIIAAFNGPNAKFHGFEDVTVELNTACAHGAFTYYDSEIGYGVKY